MSNNDNSNSPLFLEFCDFLKTSKDEINSYLKKRLCQISKEEYSLSEENFGLLSEQNSGGKCLRGALIKLGEYISSGQSHHFLAPSAAIELLQTSILIHDDIIDKSEIRRKRITIHEKVRRKLLDNSVVDNETAFHYGVSKALCLGSCGYALSYLLLLESEIDFAILIKIVRLFSKIILKTCVGETIEIDSVFSLGNKINNFKEYEREVFRIYEYKTAWYTLVGPLAMGAIVGGASEELIDNIKDFSVPLGIAFQLKDDINGIYSTEEAIGKSILSDVRENKQTLLYGYAHSHASEKDKSILREWYGNADCDTKGLEKIRQIFKDTGSLDYSEEKIKALSSSSIEILEKIDIESKYKNLLYGLVEFLLK